jgi:hypothetical protein
MPRLLDREGFRLAAVRGINIYIYIKYIIQEEFWHYLAMYLFMLSGYQDEKQYQKCEFPPQ